jgi:hypothetical protein
MPLTDITIRIILYVKRTRRGRLSRNYGLVFKVCGPSRQLVRIRIGVKIENVKKTKTNSV